MSAFIVDKQKKEDAMVKFIDTALKPIKDAEVQLVQNLMNRQAGITGNKITNQNLVSQLEGIVLNILLRLSQFTFSSAFSYVFW